MEIPNLKMHVVIFAYCNVGTVFGMEQSNVMMEMILLAMVALLSAKQNAVTI